MGYKEENELIYKTFAWSTETASAIQCAGGSVKSVMEKMSEDLVMTMIRNDLKIIYARPPQERTT